jgi:hypothetical protein
MTINNTTDLTRENYHSVTAIDGKPLISSSCLSHAYPGQGGSIIRLDAYLTAQEAAEEEEEKAHQELGSLLHVYLENSTKFAIEPEVKPEPWICSVIRIAAEKASQAVPGGVQRMEDLKPFLYPAAQENNIQSRYGEPAIIKHVADDRGAAYFHFLKENSGKYMLEAAQKEKFDGMHAAIAASPWAEVILQRKHPQAQVLSELPILWEYRGIQCKSLIDLPWIDWKNKKIRVNDFKTTSSPVGVFVHSTIILLDQDGRPYAIKHPGSFYRYRYYRQLAFYELAMKWYVSKLSNTDIREWQFTHGLFVVGSKAPHEVRYIEVTSQDIYLGMQEINTSFNDVVIPYYEKRGLIGWN